MSRTLVIAEPGCTHEGDKATLVKLLETAHACGADVFKPQWTSDPIAMCERRHIGPDHPKRTFYERAYGWLAFPVDWHHEFVAQCNALGMRYACSVYLLQDVATLAPFVDGLKISSFEAKDGTLVRAANATVGSERVIVSTGTLSATDIASAFGLFNPVLHCVSAYPAPLEALNLGALTRLRLDGFSDHSRHLLTGAVAVGAGARIIETHYRLDDCDQANPDYAVAFTPAEFQQYIQNIRDAETMMGEGIKRQQPCEAWALPYRVTS